VKLCDFVAKYLSSKFLFVSYCFWLRRAEKWRSFEKDCSG